MQHKIIIILFSKLFFIPIRYLFLYKLYYFHHSTIRLTNLELFHEIFAIFQRKMFYSCDSTNVYVCFYKNIHFYKFDDNPKKIFIAINLESFWIICSKYWQKKCFSTNCCHQFPPTKYWFVLPNIWFWVLSSINNWKNSTPLNSFSSRFFLHSNYSMNDYFFTIL